MKLIVGLGNPGSRYADTRHNVGAMVVQRLGRRGGAWKEHASGEFGYRIAEEVGLILPRVMMNVSGAAVRAAVEQWHATPQETLIVCDDVNLPVGTLRLRPHGSDGGHHGLASCLAHLGTDAVPRLRIGVGITPLPEDLTEFVLSPFDPQERMTLRGVLARAVEACELWATHGIERAMHRTNVRPSV